MDLGVTDKVRPLIAAVRAMVRDEIMPLEEEYHAEVGRDGDRFKPTKRFIEIRESLKAKARAKGLWNFWLTGSDKGYGLTTVEYAYLAEEMGWSPLASEIFNCSAPDTGNMEVIERYGSPEQKARWLPDLLEGRARSAYLMTEPGVASSDATNIAMDARLEGDEWVLNGEKWWSSGAGDPRCSLYITMTLTEPDATPHARHSMLFVPAATKGIEVLRAMKVYGDDDAPHGHMHIRFRDVRVPKDAMMLGRGRGFEIAQGRLGPGRIHHCMRAIGQAERALEAMCRRAAARTAFGQKLSRLGANPDIIAEARMSIEMARLLCLKAAWAMDTQGARAAAPLISQIKVIAPRIALEVIDQAVQMHGGAGVSQDFPLARMWTHVRTLRLADGPDAVHRRVIAKAEMKRYTNEAARGERRLPRGYARARRMGQCPCRGLARPERGEEIRRRPVEPDLSHRDGERPLRAAPQAAGQAPQNGPYDRARVSGAEGARGRGLSGAARACALRRRGRDRNRLLSHDLRRRPRPLGSGAARARARGPRADL